MKATGLLSCLLAINGDEEAESIDFFLEQRFASDAKQILLYPSTRSLITKS